uniref:NADH-ubiquinone oxidoreductase chain 2 n=1 Tax=Albinaria caerulea TaxID=42349 RepID=NU2M_ALBCA|nr:NADH dehydrogenase subunit 2 [Albinaria caerulea]P48902.1 RecName: Full=NADH-ubiquinone oxidoreductase chain 2; AltName: Full=NADH dehydrogenase subunit 2 [Albinaria caerulea]CAA58306.1 ND2 [Albinaria caerulea]
MTLQSVLLGAMIILGPILSMTSSNWIIIWIGLEISLLGFVSYYMLMKKIMSGEGIMMYFLIQSVSSTVMLLNGLYIFVNHASSYIYLFIFITMLMLKIGMFPLHFWIIPVYSKLSYLNIGIVGLLLKIVPMWILMHMGCITSEMLNLITMLSVTSMLFGALIGMNLSKMRMVLGASTITHNGWLGMSCISGSLFKYFITYGFSLVILLVFLYLGDKMSISLSLLSLSGLPPFMLFIGKINVLLMMMETNLWFIVLVFAILSAVISLVYYLKFSVMFFMNMKNNYLKHYKMAMFLLVNVTFGMLLFLT